MVKLVDTQHPQPEVRKAVEVELTLRVRRVHAKNSLNIIDISQETVLY